MTKLMCLQSANDLVRSLQCYIYHYICIYYTEMGHFAWVLHLFVFLKMLSEICGRDFIDLVLLVKKYDT